MDPMKTHGAFSWCELRSTNREASEKFYSELLGWTLENHTEGEMPYTVIKVNGEEIGGIMDMPPQAAGAPSHWASYVTVDNVDKVFQKALDMGAKPIVAPQDVPKVGRFCVIQDLQGAMINFITYETQK